ncbi:MAG: CoA ester lyase, partial [Pseudomonadota bacterium]
MTPPIRLERSVLVVPGASEKMIGKAAASDADAVCIDLEDAVAPSEKARARAVTVAGILGHDFTGKTVQVRINGLDTEFAYRDIIEVVEGAGNALDMLVLPKVSGRDELSCVSLLLDGIEAAIGTSRVIGLAALIETAEGVLNIADVVTANERLEALIFGSGDFAASMAMPLETIGGMDDHDAAYPGHRFHHALASIATAARAHGLRAIDGPFAGFKQPDLLQRYAAMSRALGFDGKWCIHPSQPAIVNAAFAPSPEDIAWANEVDSAYQAAMSAGTGAISVRGKMVDAANLRMAERILAQAKLAGMASRTSC